jgi:hypothetical protein
MRNQTLMIVDIVVIQPAPSRAERDTTNKVLDTEIIEGIRRVQSKVEKDLTGEIAEGMIEGTQQARCRGRNCRIRHPEKVFHGIFRWNLLVEKIVKDLLVVLLAETEDPQRNTILVL